MGKDAAVSAMKAGAHDYLLKNSLARLATTVLREIEDARARRDARREIIQARLELEQRVRQRTAELAETTEMLRQAHAAAEAATRAKSTFLAHMSHEIRTPMTAITGYADLLLEPGQTEEQRVQRINVIRKNSDHLLLLINGILDLSKIEAGEMTVEHVRCSPAQILNDVASTMRMHAAEKKLRLDVEVHGRIPQTIQSDPTRLKQILLNLAGNAIKFTSDGSVRVIARLEEGPPGPRMKFEVADTGPGISPESLGRLFQPFTQLDASTTRKFGGTGLGLAITKKLAKLLGGDVEVQSVPGSGSTFTLEIPTGPIDGVDRLCRTTTSRSVPRTHPLRPQPLGTVAGKILLAEDNLDNQVMLAHYLRQAGADVTVVGDGQAAYDAVMHSGQSFALVLLDMQMPVLDGYAAASRLRRDGYAGPILALTAHAMDEDRVKCIAAGCTDHLSKPIKREQLIAAVLRYLSYAEVLQSEADDQDIKQFIAEFVRRLPSQVAELQDWPDRHDLKRLDDLIHNLKGSGGTYGFERITEAAADRNGTRVRCPDGRNRAAVA